MSERFNGFSQDEINRLSKNQQHSKKLQQPENAKQAFRGQHGGIRRMPEKWSKPSAAGTVTANPKTLNSNRKATAAELPSTNTAAPHNDTDDGVNVTNLDRSMSKSLEEALFFQQPKPRKQQNAANEQNSNNAQSSCAETTSSDNSSILHLSNDDQQVTSSTDNLDDSAILPTNRRLAAVSTATNSVTAGSHDLNLDSPFKGVSLKDFETHRKMIEEQNKQKKQMLYKAIELHSQKTAAETRKIAEIKSELAKLDSDLAVDVAILRKQIDNACVHFANVEKQYIKIEAQFLRAKIDLHNAAEKKELLTEHLCTVIAHNEDRKAQKLSELMEKVGLTANGEYEAPIGIVAAAANASPANGNPNKP